MTPPTSHLQQCVRLTEAEARICRWVGEQRYAYAMRHRLDPGLGSSKTLEGAGNHVVGACCEFAASVTLNMYWRPTVGQVDSPDVGGLVEVRSTYLPQGKLIVKPDGTGPYVLVIRRSEDLRDFEAVGWMMADAAKARYPLETKFGDPSHWVPQDDLHSLDDLIVYANSMLGERAA